MLYSPLIPQKQFFLLIDKNREPTQHVIQMRWEPFKIVQARPLIECLVAIQNLLNPISEETGSNGSKRGISSKRCYQKKLPSRAFSPKYSTEQVYIVWYHRIDLGEERPEIQSAFQKQFPGCPRDVGGIQCKYCRSSEVFRVPQVRQRVEMCLPRKRTACVPYVNRGILGCVRSSSTLLDNGYKDK